MDAYSICELLKNSIWHSFRALDSNANGCVPKPRLQVFAASLGNLLSIQNVEKGLSDHRSTPYLKYNEFLFYLQKELFATLPENLSAQQFKEIHQNIDDICWLVCKHEYLDLEKDTNSESHHFKLFRIFCTLADFYDFKEPNSVLMDTDEIKLITELLDKTLGNDINLAISNSHSIENGNYTFKNFLLYISAFYKEKYEKKAVYEAVDELYDIIVDNVVKKGHLKKSLSPVGPWWEMWFVLKQHSFSWSLNKLKKDQWGEICLYSTDVKVKNETGAQFTVTFGSKSMTIYAADCATKFQWISAFNIALKHCKMLEPLQQYLAMKRQQARHHKLHKQKEIASNDTVTAFNDKQKLEEVLETETERLRNLRENNLSTHGSQEPEEQNEEMQDVPSSVRFSAEIDLKENILLQKEAELDEERQRRVQLESWQNERRDEINKLISIIANLEKDKEQLSGTLKSKLHVEEALKAKTERLKEFERREKMLLEQLKEERQAKEDEEIVRDLQSRKLAEEWEKIEVMEKEQLQKEAELCEERKKREELEMWQKKRQEEMDHLANIVTNLEKEKEQLHGTLKKTKVLLAKPRKEIKEMIAPQNLKRSHSADFSFMKDENFSILPGNGEDF